MEQLAPNYRMPTDWQQADVILADVLQSFGLTEENLHSNIRLVQVNPGNSVVVIGVKDGTTLGNLTPDFDLTSIITKN
jgi:predicted PhzF superfamily epimerase YddE/YHI9